jgi:hypothetical protein
VADGAALGAPACTPDHNIYLKSVYTCVNKNIFKVPIRRNSVLAEVFSHKISFQISRKKTSSKNDYKNLFHNNVQILLFNSIPIGK